ncbi:hypothetical protein ACT3T8_15985 [Halomonas sp. AOP1-B1-8]|uniref:hypothetical protein n=1 Tax=Halomonas sp. AOP1-B1-8 TaxID=3457726 RepID=UPI003FDB0A2E
MADKQPTREELLLDWFIGDAKDIMAELTEVKESVQQVHKTQQEESAASVAALKELNQQAVSSQRELARVAKEGAQQIEVATNAAATHLKKASAATHRRIAAVAFFAAAVGALIGACVAMLGFMLIAPL